MAEKQAIKYEVDYLPQDFSLEEEEDFVYLLYKEERIASFSAIGAEPEMIKTVAECYLLAE